MTTYGRARTFGEVATAYDRWRPDYPAAAVDWLAPAAPARVADVGAGTGKLTGLLLDRGLTVEAVEPDDRMLAVLRRRHPGARTHHGDAARIPVGDGSLDAVLVADAWHWFDPGPTVAEVRRVLAPGGWLGLVWNVGAPPVEAWEHDLSDDSAEYDRASKASPEGLNTRLAHLDPDELTFEQFTWTWEVSADHWASLHDTTSMAIALPADQRSAALAQTRARFQRICEEHGRRTMPLRYVASCVRWAPRDA